MNLYLAHGYGSDLFIFYSGGLQIRKMRNRQHQIKPNYQNIILDRKSESKKNLTSLDGQDWPDIKSWCYCMSKKL